MNKIANMALQGGILHVYGGGNCLRDYVYITDVARAFLATGNTRAAVGLTFNVAGGRGTTIREVFSLGAQRIQALTGKPVSIEAVPWPPEADNTEYRDFVCDIAALETAAGWQPLISLEDGIGRMMRHFLA